MKWDICFATGTNSDVYTCSMHTGKHKTSGYLKSRWHLSIRGNKHPKSMSNIKFFFFCKIDFIFLSSSSRWFLMRSCVYRVGFDVLCNYFDMRIRQKVDFYRNEIASWNWDNGKKDVHRFLFYLTRQTLVHRVSFHSFMSIISCVVFVAFSCTQEHDTLHWREQKIICLISMMHNEHVLAVRNTLFRHLYTLNDASRIQLSTNAKYSVY